MFTRAFLFSWIIFLVLISPLLAETSLTQIKVNGVSTEINHLTLTSFYEQVAVVPKFKNAAPYGLKINRVKVDTDLYKLGIRPGDIVISINGYLFSDMGGQQIFDNLKGKKEFVLKLERNGLEQEIKYQVEKK